MNKGILLFIICFMQILLLACANKEELQQKNHSEENTYNQLTMAFNLGFESGFDPIKGWGFEGSPLFQSTLFKKDKNLNIINDLAVNYEVHDGIWTIYLRNDAMFSDGKKLTAHDVAFTYNKLLENKKMIHSNIIDQVTVISNAMVEFHLKKETPEFIDILVHTGIVPQHAYSATYYQDPIGSGPYKLVEWKKNEYLKIEANKYYYDSLPMMEDITILFLNDEMMIESLKNGQIDLAYIPATYSKEAIDGMEIKVVDTLDFQGISFPVLPEGTFTEEGIPIGNDVTSDIAIRQAINLAIDRQVLVDEVLQGYGSPAYADTDQLPWTNEDPVIEDGDITKAKKMLNEAGWQQNDKGIFEKNGLIAEITLYYPMHDSIRQSLAVQVANMLKDVGISVQVEGADWDHIRSKMHSNPILFGWGSHSAYEMYQLYSSEFAGVSNKNSGFYKNKDVDQYFEQALEATEESVANEFWKLAQWNDLRGYTLIGNTAYTWLVNRDHIYFVNKKLNIQTQENHVHGHGWSVTSNIVDWKWNEK